MRYQRGNFVFEWRGGDFFGGGWKVIGGWVDIIFSWGGMVIHRSIGMVLGWGWVHFYTVVRVGFVCSAHTKPYSK